MRYWHPRAQETVREVAAYAPDQVILLPLYPQYSTTTTASSLEEWRREAKAAGLRARTQALCCYPEETGFVEAVVEGLRSALRQIDHESPPRVLFSAHGLPKKNVDGGDPRSAEHTSELQSLMRISYTVFCLKKHTPILNSNQHQSLIRII